MCGRLTSSRWACSPPSPFIPRCAPAPGGRRCGSCASASAAGAGGSDAPQDAPSLRGRRRPRPAGRGGGARPRGDGGQACFLLRAVGTGGARGRGRAADPRRRPCRGRQCRTRRGRPDGALPRDRHGGVAAGALFRGAAGPFRRGTGGGRRRAAGADGVFAADTILAKHDENYMPPEVADMLEEGARRAGDGG